MSESLGERRRHRAVFFDRDGVLNELVVREGVPVSPRHVGDFRLRDGAVTMVERIRGLGFHAFVASNQPDIARGLLNPRDLDQMTRRLQAALLIEEVVICPHDDIDVCACRKPRPGMLLHLAKRWDLDLSGSFIVGDSWRDMEAGRRAGCRRVLVRPAAGNMPEADAVVRNLTEVVSVIESSL